MAAGSSSRFGVEDKRLAEFQNTTLLNTLINKITALFQHHVLVLSSNDSLVDLNIQQNYTDLSSIQIAESNPANYVFYAQNAHTGLGSSIGNVFSEVNQKALPNCLASAAIFLADMPHIKNETIQLVTNNCDLHKIHRPTLTEQQLTNANLKFKNRYGKLGHPVVFGKQFWQELAGLNGDSGAAAVIKKHTQHLSLIEVDDLGVILDIDFKEDLNHK
ncbi:hypothetical protein MAH1_16620 [Sessilibacter sp. MAH1]